MPKAPDIEPDWALFLDLDGTLLDIAAAPDQVVVPSGLVQALVRVHERLSGALAIVTGRRLADLERLLEGIPFAVAAEHGAVLRYGSGMTEELAPAARPTGAWFAQLVQATRTWPGVLVEQKLYSIAIHFRGAPDREGAIRDLADALVRGNPMHFELVGAKLAIEIRPRGVTKGRAVMRLMEQAPFRGRLPVFVGDDVTDLDGMEAARAMGGRGLHVAKDFGGAPSAVRTWLKRAAGPPI